MMKTVRPLNKRVAIKLDPPKGTSEGGIVIPEKSQDVPEWGTVLAFAEDCETINETGIRVFASKHQGTNIGQGIVLLEESKIKAMEMPTTK